MKLITCALLTLFLGGAYSCALAGGPAGHVDSFSISSSVLDQERSIHVALPDGYEAGADHYPVLYVLDARWHFLTAVSATRFLAETSYISAHRVPPLIVVGIESIDRNHEYTPTQAVSQHGMSFPTSGGADGFLEFLGDELVPEIDRRYRTEPFRILAGWSLGGLLTMHALFDHPGLFGAHLAVSPSLWWDGELLVERGIELAGAGRALERELVVTIGTGEEGGLCFNAVHRLDDAWAETPVPGLEYSSLEVEGEDHNHGPYGAYFSGLRSLFADWFYPEDAFTDGLESLAAHYAALSELRGYTIEIPGHLYDALARSYVSEGRQDEAIAVQEHRCASEPESALAFYFLGETCRQVESVDRAREAYLRALELERAAAAPDTVFTSWLEGRLDGLNTGS